jgi:hypothetical protein|nr:hypothetical protein [uncultured Mediterranean phage uvMED]BAR25730.1 hypothetical protein [uncultured Mediterranean phage uvMED]|tara:strand:- start:1830 stop:2288 length:459 start_codon:yes stop_codon:yes gene_type:complete
MTTRNSKKNSQEAFYSDLIIGKNIEKKVLSSIQKKYPSAVLIPRKFSKYDIFVPEVDKKIEVKFDYKSQETKNILIELFMFKKPSALLATEADYWAIDTGKEVMWTTPKKILECILINNIRSQKITGDGDTQAKIACLIPIKLFKKYTVNTI